MPAELYFTDHAAQKMRDRDITIPEVADVIDNYRQSWTTRGQTTYQGELITVVGVRYPGKIRVVTVLLNSEDHWSDEDVRARART